MTIYLDLKTIGLGNNLFMISAAMQLALEKSTDFVCLPIASKGFNDEILNLKPLGFIKQKKGKYI